MKHQGPQDADCTGQASSWLHTVVQALASTTASAASADERLQQACSSLLAGMRAAGVWILGPGTGPAHVLYQAVDADGPVATPEELALLPQALAPLVQRAHAARSRVVEHGLAWQQRVLVGVCCPLPGRQGLLGSLVCLLHPGGYRGDDDLGQLQLCADLLAMAMAAAPVPSQAGQEGQWARRYDALSTVLPGSAVVLSLQGHVTVAPAGGVTVPGLDKLQRSLGAVAAQPLQGAAGIEHTRRQSDAFCLAVQGQPSRCHVHHQGPDGLRVIEQRFSPVGDANGGTREVALYASDVTDVVRLKQSLRELSERDGVTGSMTMATLMQHARARVGALDASGRRPLLMSIVTEAATTAAHRLDAQAHENLLQAISGRIGRGLPGVGSIARRGERNFVAVIDVDQQEGRRQGADLAARVVNELREPFVIGRKELIMSVAVGYALFPHDGQDAEQLLGHADIAAAAAQRAGRNCAMAFRQEMVQDAQARTRLESQLYRAVENDEFVLAFQPKVDIRQGTISGVEALLRWQGNPAVGPARFIPVAEECGLISFIGEWAFRRACQTAVRWSDAGMRTPIAVNVSSRQFHDDDFHGTVSAILAETGCDPSLIEMELTEGAMFADPSAAVLSFGLLKDMGLSLSIDDFGMGFSSLAYLKHLPADCLKIDKAFVQGLPTDHDNGAIARAIVAMAKAMNMRVVAEGVEKMDCLQYLRDMGCDEAQGYYFSKPLSEQDFISWREAYCSISA